MKKVRTRLSLIAGLSVLFVLTAATAQAQGTAQSTRVSVPFSFAVGSETLPAGTYVISENRNTLTIRSTKGNSSVAVLPARTIGNGRQAAYSRAVFKRYGSDYYLSEIWLAAQGLGHELKVRVTEPEIAMNPRQGTANIVIAGQ
jgi:P pilus assembly chaperone PapD